MVSEDSSDASPVEDDELSDMPEFERELLLAEKHAEEVRLKQRMSLLWESSGVGPDSTGLYEDLYYLDDVVDETSEKLQEPGVLFKDDNKGSGKTSKASKSDPKVAKSGKISQSKDEDDKPTFNPITVSIANSAKLSKTRTLNILEHPNFNEYLSGALINLFITVESLRLSPVKSSPKRLKAVPICELFPKLISKHVVFQIECAVPSETYDVFGSNLNSCDHFSKLFLSKCSYVLCGKVLNVATEASNTFVLVSVCDICNSSFQEEQLNFGDEYFAEFLKQISDNLKSVLFLTPGHSLTSHVDSFTFTDEDVQIILEQKLRERSSIPNKKTSLISEIQRYTHEIELLSESAKNDPSQILRLKDHEKRRQELVDDLNNLGDSKTNSRFSLRNSSIISTSDDLSNKTVTRKITKPTPMIMGTLSLGVIPLFSLGLLSIFYTSSLIYTHLRLLVIL
eukprot:XP_762744.1 hypothetical protein [Theileria parva strain Muguga]